MSLRILYLLLPLAGIVWAAASPKLGPFEGYRSWTKVNPKPLQMPIPLVMLCRGLTPDEQEQLDNDPHHKYYFTVYVNGKGRKAMRGPTATLFPVGTAIIKEKLTSDKDGKLLMMTAMLKRRQSNPPNISDWEFSVLDPTGKATVSGDGTKHCVGCHTGQIDRDFTYRTYVPRAKQESGP